MNVFEKELRSLRQDMFWFQLTECVHGALLAALAYLFVCVGSGIIPWRIADYFMLVGMAGISLSAASVAQDQSWNWRSLIPVIILAPICFMFYVISTFRMPGTEFTTRESTGGIILFPLIAIIVLIARRPRSIATISTSFLLTLCAGSIGVHFLTAHAMQKEIALTLVKGGCVVSTGEFDQEKPRLIRAVGDVKIGIVSTTSDRIYFINKSNVESWSYSAIELQPRRYFKKEILTTCNNKKGGMSAAPSMPQAGKP
jgi:hypothetical protein